MGTYIVFILLFSLSGIAASNISKLPSCDPKEPLVTSSFSNVVVGIMLNLGGHCFLPGVWREMAEPEKRFKWVSGAAFASMSVIYLIVGGLGYAVSIVLNILLLSPSLYGTNLTLTCFRHWDPLRLMIRMVILF